MSSYPFNPDWVVAPGETLKDWFEEMGLPLRVGNRYGLTEQVLEEVIAGEREIDEPLAIRLGALTLIGKGFWLALEHNYRVGLAAGKKRV